MSYPKVIAKEKVSPSAMSRFAHCPAQWRYEILHSQELIPALQIYSPEAMLGTNFHNAIIPDYFEHISDHPQPAEIDKTARESFDNNYDRSLYTQEDKAHQILDNFISFEQHRAKSWVKYKPDFIEKRLDSDKWSGIVDFYDAGIVIDWKTGNVTDMTEDIMRQGSVYKVLIPEVLKLPVNRVLFVVLSLGKVIELPNSISSGWIEEQRRHYLDSVKAENFKPNKSPLCRYCPFILRCFMEGHSNLWQDLL